eukprot:TRINITY_DN173_c0_g3_i2.p1 TRINITY_DN173_c0_g3~~TRINITY_DN173_c0_g3_i2.p1  ORF type:complete len:294 (+),score=55.34 TRINITY_DN173_c0_g3_i2:39-920(+)
MGEPTSKTLSSPTKDSPNQASHLLSTQNITPIDGNCSICLNSTRAENKAFIDDCMHEFCYECIAEWVKTKLVCPLCKLVFTKLYKYDSGSLIEETPLPPPKTIDILPSDVLDSLDHKFYMEEIERLLVTSQEAYQRLFQPYHPKNSSAWKDKNQVLLKQTIDRLYDLKGDFIEFKHFEGSSLFDELQNIVQFVQTLYENPHTEKYASLGMARARRTYGADDYDDIEEEEEDVENYENDEMEESMSYLTVREQRMVIGGLNFNGNPHLKNARAPIAPPSPSKRAPKQSNGRRKR